MLVRGKTPKTPKFAFGKALSLIQRNKVLCIMKSKNGYVIFMNGIVRIGEKVGWKNQKNTL